MTNMPRRDQAARAERLSAFPLGSQQGCYVTDSSSGDHYQRRLFRGQQLPAVDASGTSSDVTVSRIAIAARKGVQVEPR